MQKGWTNEAWMRAGKAQGPSTDDAPGAVFGAKLPVSPTIMLREDFAALELWTDRPHTTTTTTTTVAVDGGPRSPRNPFKAPSPVVTHWP